MTSTVTIVTTPPRGDGRMASIRRFVKTEPIGVVSIVVIAFVVFVAVFAPLLAPYDPLAQNRADILVPPSAQYWMGTDWLGRDVLSRIIFGAQTSLVIAVATTVIAGVIGVTVGVISGYAGGFFDLAVQRIADAIESVPPIVLLLLIAAIMGPSIPNTVFALMIMLLPSFNRVARGEVLRIKREPFVEAAVATGVGPARIVVRHVLPNMMGPILTLATLRFAGVIIAESALSFLGLGPPPPTPSWGGMLSSGVQYIDFAPWLIVFPAIALSVAVLAFNLLGDSLRDFLDPKLVR